MRNFGIALATLALTLGAPAAALAQDPGANDPSAGTPAGTIYQIPLDTARHDAAPRPKGGSSTSGGGSPLRSENDFGSSSQVPGAGSGSGSGSGGTPAATATAIPVATATASAGKSAASGSAKARKQRSSSGSAAAQSQDGSAAGTKAGAGGREALIRPLSTGGPSSARVYLLIIIAAAVAVALGAVARLAARRR
jgi:hypothetical protein